MIWWRALREVASARQVLSLLVGIVVLLVGVVWAGARSVGLIPVMAILAGLALISVSVGPSLWRRYWPTVAPRLTCECGRGAPYDDTIYGDPTNRTQSLPRMLAHIRGEPDAWAFAKKIRVRALGRPIRVLDARLVDSPIGEMDLPWHGQNQVGERLLHPANQNDFLVLPTGLFPVGTSEIRMELVREDRQVAESFTATVTRPSLVGFLVVEGLD